MTNKRHKQISDKLMELTIKPFPALPCSAKVFEINKIKCELDDWGYYTEDDCPEDCIGYDCHNKIFHAFEVEKIRKHLPENLKSLTDDEIQTVSFELAAEFCIGDCNWCL